jgi:dihydroneopterin aldolase/2-amino-4-hydroxy-6-hydroxymethyldihydropteridine diphosphokinase
MAAMEWAVNDVGEPLDSIEILGISAHGYHGLLEGERFDGQVFTVDVRMRLDTRSAAARDSLDGAVDYAAVAREVVEIVTGQPVFLLETLAQRIAEAVLAHPGVQCVDLTVHKPQAPVGVPVQDVLVRIHRNSPMIVAAHQARAARGQEGAARAPQGADGEARAAALAHPDLSPQEALRLAGVPLTRRALAEARAAAAGAEPAPKGGIRSGEMVAADPLPPAPPGPPRVAASAASLAAEVSQRPYAVDVSQSPAVDLDSPPRWPADVILALGGNVGDALGSLRAAVEDLASVPGIEILGVSPLARTRAVGPDQPDFFNAVVAVRTTLAPRALLHTIQGIEDQHGRARNQPAGPRTLDIDIVAYDTLLAADEELTLPHPRAHERAFVLLPWATLSPSAFLPGLDGGAVAMLADVAPDRDGVRWLALDWLTIPVALSGALPKAPDPAPAIGWS